MQHIALILMILSTLTWPALADPGHHHGDYDAECRCETPHDEEHHFSEDRDYTRAFKEGSPNLTTPHVLEPDTFSLFYSHNFFVASVPFGSNPNFWAKYSPFENVQLDAMASLRSPREFEFGLAYQLLDEYAGDWLSLTPRLAYNTRGNVFGAELSATRFIFPELWQVGLDARVLSNASGDSIDRPVAALGFNTMVRVWKHWHLYGDLVVPFDTELLQRPLLWSTGIKKRIPHTPHVLTLYVGNSQEQTLLGRTIGLEGQTSDLLKVGFVFSIEIPQVSRMPERLF